MLKSLSPVLALCCFFTLSLSSAPNFKPNQQDKVSLLYFGATWCPPCTKMKQLFKDTDVKKELEKYNFNIYDYDKNKDLAKKYKVTVVPTMIFQKDKKIIQRYKGGTTKQALLKILRKNSS